MFVQNVPMLLSINGPGRERERTFAFLMQECEVAVRGVIDPADPDWSRGGGADEKGEIIVVLGRG